MRKEKPKEKRGSEEAKKESKKARKRGSEVAKKGKVQQEDSKAEGAGSRHYRGGANN